MIRQDSGRSVIHCDRCPVRLDLGPFAIVTAHMRRMPSGWLQDGPDRHMCPLCARKEITALASNNAT